MFGAMTGGPFPLKPTLQEPSAQTLREFVDGYLECALWAETDDETPLDTNYGPRDIAAPTVQAMVAECREFLSDNFATLELFGEATFRDWSYAGHDFWLTRCGHGTGFWDRYMDAEPDEREGAQAAGEALSEKARAYRNAELYVGDESLIWQLGTEPAR